MGSAAFGGRPGAGVCDKIRTMIDVIVIGAGLGGLMAASKLAAAGKKVLVLEKQPYAGGTSSIFGWNGYTFPMGPLSFSFPGRVQGFLEEAGIEEKIEFRRQGFELRTPDLDVMMSQPLAALEAKLTRLFPGERAGLIQFFRQLDAAISVSKEMDRWHPDFAAPAAGGTVPRRIAPADPARVDEVRRLSRLPAARVLDALIGSAPLRNFLGSQSTSRPEMSMLNLASMWNVMAVEGIWFPSCGVHGVADLLVRRLQELGVKIRLSAPVRKILVRNGRAAGVVTSEGEAVESRWVISDADYKTTLLDLVDAAGISGIDLSAVRDVPYSGSELCVYLGLRPDEVDLRAIRAEHLFFRKEIRGRPEPELEDFDDREIEICFWSRKAPGMAPAGRASLILRVGFPYRHFEAWNQGYRLRKEGYGEYKQRLARRLIGTAESVLPGLSRAVEVMEAATPLTYRDWGNRFEGSIAGWTWSALDSARLPGKILVKTPVTGLLAVGAYAASELFLGGVPTALYTGSIAADLIQAG
jgi:phytoene dehydrogenase-like protein